MTNITYYDTPKALDEAVRRMIIPTDVVLDVGCGMAPQTFITPKTHICIDAFAPYIGILQKDHQDKICMAIDWSYVMVGLPYRSIDTVIALDFIEHLERDAGIEFLERAEVITRKQIVIFTPIGFFPQKYSPVDRDRYGFSNWYLQTHRSGWTPEDFGEDWQVLACKEYHKRDQYGNLMEQPIGAMYCIYTKE